MGYNLLVNGVYWGYNPLIYLLLTSWDIQVYIYICVYIYMYIYMDQMETLKQKHMFLQIHHEKNPAWCRVPGCSISRGRYHDLEMPWVTPLQP